jgi:hypothetical protein
MKYLLIILIIFLSFDLLAQKNEISTSCSNVYCEKEIKQGIGFHYLHDKSQDRLAQGDYKLGFGVEKIIHGHNSFGLIVNTQIIDNLSFGVSPRIVFSENYYSFGFHVDCEYGVEMGPLCLGPCVHFSIHQNESHIGLGIHLGFGF